MRGKTLVKGHTLFRRGWACYRNGDERVYNWATGCALCSCGEISDLLFSTAARKRWHKQHKAEVLKAMEVKGEQD